MNFGKKSVADKRDKLTSANARTGRSAGVYALRTGFFLLLLLVVTNAVFSCCKCGGKWRISQT